MTYAIVYGDHVLDRLFDFMQQHSLPSLVDSVEAEMERLAADPVGLSVRGRSLYQLPDGKIVRPQQFEFCYEAESGQRVYIQVSFYYNEDEYSILVVALIPSL
jgi:hypothetical protein